MQRLIASLPAECDLSGRLPQSPVENSYLQLIELSLKVSPGCKNRQHSFSSQLAVHTAQKEDSISRENMECGQ